MLRSEEMSEEVQDRMLSIQKREADQFAELTEFLDTEIAYVALYHDILLQLRLDWPDPYVALLPFVFHLTQAPELRPMNRATANVKSLTHRQSFIRETEEPPPRGSLSSERDRPPPSPTRKRANTSTGSVLPSLSHNRKRSDSLVTTETNGSGGSAPPAANGNAKADGKSESGSTIKGKASGWMGTISRSRKNSSVSKKNFQSLGDDEEHEPVPPHSFSTTANITSTSNNTTSSRPRSASSANASAPSTASASLRMRKPPAPPVRAASTRSRPPSLTRLRALYDLVNVAPDELAFRAGDVVTVLDESFDALTLLSDSSSWVRVEKDGFVGLVPMNYFEVVPASPRKAVARAPGLPTFGGANGYNASTDETDESDSPSSSLLHDAIGRQSTTTSTGLLGHKRGGSRGAPKSTSFPDLHHQQQRNQNLYDSHDDDSASNNDYGYDDGALGEEEHVFGDKYSMTSPTVPSSSHYADDSPAPGPRVRAGSSTLFPPPSHSSPHLTTSAGGRMSKTAPPSPIRPPAPPIPTSSSTSYNTHSNVNGTNTNSPRQLPVSIANAVAAAAAAGKKPPPPPPPARRAQSSAYIGGGVGGGANVNASNSSFASGSSGGTGAPPLPPPPRRPGLPVRPVTSTEGRSLGLSPFDT